VKTIKVLCFCLVFIVSLVLSAQNKNLKGQLIADDEVEGLHILNKTASKYTISNKNGSFIVPAKVSDTLYISGVKYEAQEVVISSSIIELGQFNVQLIEKVNALNEVVVGEILTGSLESDTQNSDAKPEINFYDLGIPGNTDLPLTQSEQRLYDADHGNFVYYYGIGIAINVNKILNRINGDTKEYKKRIEIEFKEKCINRLKSEYSQTIFEVIIIPKHYTEEFFQFCLEDNQFMTVCEDENKLNAVGFLLYKLKIFKINLNEDD
jgi:hypothetical protein